MAFVDQHAQIRLKPVVGVALVHLAIGYAFISGLASDAIRQAPAVFRLLAIAEIAPPPPTVPDAVQPKSPQPRPVTAPRRQVDLPAQPQVDPVVVAEIAPLPATTLDTVTLPATPRPSAPSRASQAKAKGGRGGWITSDDYPSRSLRNGEEGTVAISALIGANGQVSGCTVTVSSGFPLLDEATCRLYQRRARFSPALDDAGRATASTTTDRIRWTIPR